MLHHVEIYVSDLDRAFDFWSELLSLIGYAVVRFRGGFSLEQSDGPYLTFVQVDPSHLQSGYHRKRVGLNHLAFTVHDRATVDRLRDYCVAKGLRTLYDDKYPHANGGDEYYALYVEDPDRIKVEFVANLMKGGA